jgi:ubiquinone/menaquinone biosynthesis C-methylase UbiE
MKKENLRKEFLYPEKIISQLEINLGDKIADLGCGSGFFSIPSAKASGEDGKVVAVDILEKKLEAVRSRAKLEFLFNIDTKRFNLEEKGSLLRELGENSFDLVILANTLSYVEDDERFLWEVSQILNKNGRLAVLDWKKKPFFIKEETFSVKGFKKMKLIFDKLEFRMQKELDSGFYHWGFLFKKEQITIKKNNGFA